MEHPTKDINKGHVTWPARLPAALALLGATLALGACGGTASDDTSTAGSGDGGAAAAAAAGSGGGSAAETSDQAVKYSQCMREHGIKEFPDPQNGRLTLRAGPGSGLNPDSPAFKAAEKACQSLAPAGAQNAGGGAGQNAALDFAKCMRGNGVPKFPDPETSRGKVTMRLTPDSGVDPNSASFKAAQAKCGSMMPGGATQGTAP
ncbi:MAG TPA: hypothetical protein VK501_20430 [Baekduia sp.]|uniref:hypothetical protein n=1 Tax=Baekduia sp. TaxID=2600305 RepID=UPI002C879555|nr:hypothetical protein [Baekduia sp.]HMJ36280.1 hypothetical protein [Baekduia sp.]